MSESVGRAGFNVRHLRHGESGTRADRASLLRESMRELDDEAAAYYAAANPNIVAADTRLNVAMVNDGQGGFRRAKSTAEVLAYGDARIGTKQNPKSEDRVGNTGRKWNPKSFETTLIVVSLPRSMCVEIPNAYPLRDDNGEPVTDLAGNPVMRSRWVPRDRDEALRYFAESADFLGSDVLPGGHDAMHGYDVNLDESYPHAQYMTDTLADDPKNPGLLRVAAQQAWGVSREVLDHRGRIEQPQAKMTRYQKAYREHMHGLGYDVELEASERSKSSHTREEWAALKERERASEAFGDKVAEFAEKVTRGDEINKAARAQLDARESAVAAREQAAVADRAQLDRDLDDLPRLRAAARAEGLKAAEASAETAVADRIANAEAEAQRIITAAQEAAQEAVQDRLDAADEEIATERAKLTETPMAFDEFLNQETKAGRDTAERYRKHTELYYLHNKRRPQFLNDHDRAAMRGERKKTVSGHQQLVASMEEDKKKPNTSGSGEDGQGFVD